MTENGGNGANFELILKSAIFQNGGQRARIELNLSLKSVILQYGGQRGNFELKFMWLVKTVHFTRAVIGQFCIHEVVVHTLGERVSELCM